MKNDTTSQIDLRRMRAIVEVARAEAITTAAQTLGLTQSAVSRTVAEVEEALGQRLFDRLPRGIQLTDTGRAFVQRARRVLADVDDLMSELSAEPSRITGRLRLGIAATGFPAVAACAAFAGLYPDVAIETVHASEQTLCPRLLQGELDMVIGSSNYLQRWRELEVKALTRLYFACMMRKQHPLSQVRRATEIEVLGYPMVLPESIEASYSDIARRYAHHGLPKLQPRYVTNNFELIVGLLEATDAFMPMMHPEAAFGGLGERFMLLRDVVEMPTHYVSFACVAHRPQHRVAALFGALLIDTLEDRSGR